MSLIFGRVGSLFVGTTDRVGLGEVVPVSFDGLIAGSRKLADRESSFKIDIFFGEIERGGTKKLGKGSIILLLQLIVGLLLELFQKVENNLTRSIVRVALEVLSVKRDVRADETDPLISGKAERPMVIVQCEKLELVNLLDTNVGDFVPAESAVNHDKMT